MYVKPIIYPDGLHVGRVPLPFCGGPEWQYAAQEVLRMSRWDEYRENFRYARISRKIRANRAMFCAYPANENPL